jgi:hypothetical protein
VSTLGAPDALTHGSLGDPIDKARSPWQRVSKTLTKNNITIRDLIKVQIVGRAYPCLRCVIVTVQQRRRCLRRLGGRERNGSRARCPKRRRVPQPPGPQSGVARRCRSGPTAARLATASPQRLVRESTDRGVASAALPTAVVAPLVWLNHSAGERRMIRLESLADHGALACLPSDLRTLAPQGPFLRCRPWAVLGPARQVRSCDRPLFSVAIYRYLVLLSTGSQRH